MLGYLILAALIIFVFIKRGDLLAGIGRTAMARGNVQKGYRWLQRGYEWGGMGFQNKLSYAFLTFKNGDLEKANTLFNLLLMEYKKPDEQMRIKGSQALIYWKNKDYPTAIEILEEVLKRAKSSVVYGSLGLVYYESGNYQRALELNREAYEYNPDDMVIMDNYAISLFQAGELEQSEEIYQKLHEKSPHFPEAFFGYGKLLLAKGEFERGITMMEEALTKRFQFTSTITYDEIAEYIETAKAEHTGTEPTEPKDESETGSTGN